jgi:hypothetical protein
MVHDHVLFFVVDHMKGKQRVLLRNIIADESTIEELQSFESVALSSLSFSRSSA